MVMMGSGFCEGVCASQASVGWPHRAHGTGSGPTEVSHLLDSSAKAPWASTVHVRALAEQDAHAGRHYNGLQEVDRARAGPRGLAEAHLSNGAVPPPDTARRNVTHVPPANYCMFFDGSTGPIIGWVLDGHSCPLHLGARIGRALLYSI